MNPLPLFPQDPPLPRKWGGWQFSLRRMFAATAAVATIFSLAAWGGWVKSDAPVYLAILACLAVFSAIVRRIVLAACVIFGLFWLSCILSYMQAFLLWGQDMLYPVLWWIFAGFLLPLAIVLRSKTKMTAFSLLASLILFMIFFTAMIIYESNITTLFQAFSAEHRAVVLQRLRASFFFHTATPLIVIPWIFGIIIGEIIARRR